jgi:hypothetical protein
MRIAVAISVLLASSAAFAQVAPMPPTNLIVDGGTSAPPAGSWPQPPMAGMPVVNAPPSRVIHQGWTGLRIMNPSPEGVERAGDGVGSFRTTCKPSHMNFDDPLLYPGAANAGRAHHHTFFGNTSVWAGTDLDNLRNVGGSSCSGGSANKSAYWVPSMIDTRTGTPLVPHSIGVYYKSGYGLRNEYRSQIQPFPAGLKILAGVPMASSVPSNAKYQIWCEGGGSSDKVRTIPNCPAGSEMWLQLEFPECWDGKNLDSPDHKSHMAYAGDNGGRCPSTHPVPITTITFNIIYAVKSGDDTRAWSLSSDMSPNARGASMHGDWINGWDPEIHQLWLNNCTKAGVDCHTDNLGDGRRLQGD